MPLVLTLGCCARGGLGKLRLGVCVVVACIVIAHETAVVLVDLVVVVVAIGKIVQGGWLVVL